MRNALVAALVAAAIAAPTGYALKPTGSPALRAKVAQLDAEVGALRCHHRTFEDGSVRHADAETEYLPCMEGDPDHTPHWP